MRAPGVAWVMHLLRSRRSSAAIRRRRPVSAAAYLDLLEHSPRQLVIGSSPDSGLVGDGVGVDFEFVEQQLVAHAVSPQAVYEARGRHLLQLRG